MPTNALLAQLLEPLQLAGVTVDQDGRVAFLNDAARGLLGLPADETPQGTPLRALLGDPEGGGIDEILGQVMAGAPWRGEMSVRVAGGDRARLGLQVTPVRPVDSTATGVVGAVALIERLGAISREEHRLGDRLARLADVTGGLTQAQDLDTVTTLVVEDLADAAGATVASVSLLEGPETLTLARVRGGKPGVQSRWRRFPVAGTPVGDALLADRIVVLRDDEIRERYPQVERAAEGERSMVCLPLKAAGVPVGALGLSFPGFREFDAAELAFLGSLADIAAQAVERVRAAVEARDHASKLEFLASATEQLGASLDYEATLRAVARLAVPWFADWCSISLAEDGLLRTLAVAHVDPDKVALAEDYMRRYPTDPESPTGSYAVLRSGRSQVTEVTDEMLDRAGLAPEQRQLVDALGLRSVLMVPLRIEDRVLGVAAWVSSDPSRRFARRDQQFGEDLGRRAAVAIDNARLHSEVREVAERLQRAVLPQRLAEVPGWEAAACYRSAGHSEIGGDFYDYIALPDDRVAMFVGDVMGRGVQAAAAMAHIRAATRTLVALDPEPAAVLAGLDRLFTHYAMSQLVTLVYAVADPSTGRVEVANAGHLPPLLRHGDGTVARVEGRAGILLGAGGGIRRTVTVRLAPGDLIALFTDGLVERRGEDIDLGVDRLGQALRTLDGDPLGPALDAIVDRIADVSNDDVAALVVRRTEPVLAHLDAGQPGED